MPTGSFDLNPVPSQIANQALPIYVCLYTPGGENPYTILPNVRCLRIDYREGPEPPVARFQYLMDDLLQSALGWPSQFEQLWPIDAQGNYVVLTDDRLVVLTADPDGNPIVLFDGFAQVPQVDLSAQRQGVSVVALGVAIRLWDEAIRGRTQRSAADATDSSGSSDFDTDLPCRFNPSDTSVGSLAGYIGNCVASSDFTEDEDEGNYPVFLDPLVIERGENDTTYWFVSDVLKYLIAIEPSPTDALDHAYVEYPTIDSLDAILSAYYPPDNGVFNSSTAQSADIKIRDYDATNKTVPDVFADLLGYAGFVMVFTVATAGDGTPTTSLRIKRRDALASTAPKPVYLAANGATSFNLSQNNATALHMARDCNQVVNAWDVETQLKQVEISVYLAPGFTPSAGDAADPKPFLSSNLTGATGAQRRMYRWYIADECGDGHWNVNDADWNQIPLDLSPIFPPDDDAKQAYVERYRPGSTTLISKDAEGKPLKAVLELTKGFASEDPTLVANNTDGWLTITHGWRLLDDRLGIELTVENPDQWGSGNPKLNDVRGVLWLATPTADTNFLLRLTTVIESDQQMLVEAPKRIASPTQFSRWRSADAKDHFQYCSIAVNSLNYTAQGGDGTNPVVARDDTKAAQTHVDQLRSAHEFPTLAGSATVPFITDYYQIGDRIKIVQGRDASLQINVGIDQGETPSYPWVTAFSWDFQGDRQQTVLQLSDRRAEPQGV